MKLRHISAAALFLSTCVLIFQPRKVKTQEPRVAASAHVRCAGQKGSDKLLGKGASHPGADSRIGRALAALYAREGADVAIVYLNGAQHCHSGKLTAPTNWQQPRLVDERQMADDRRAKNQSWQS
jgi:hypothetical protein